MNITGGKLRGPQSTQEKKKKNDNKIADNQHVTGITEDA